MSVFKNKDNNRPQKQDKPTTSQSKAVPVSNESKATDKPSSDKTSEHKTKPSKG